MASPPRLTPRAVRGIVFDLDGTLVDSYEAIAASLNAARAAHGLPPLASDDVRRRVGRGLETLIEENVGPAHVVSGVRVFREVYAAAWPSGTRILPGVRETLASLHSRGFALSVASNKPAAFSVRILESVGLAPLLASVEGPDTAGDVKPAPAMIHRCLHRMGVTAASAVYVGDMLLDVESAARAGVPVLLVTGGSSEPGGLAASGQHVLDRFEDLLDILPSPASGEHP